MEWLYFTGLLAAAWAGASVGWRGTVHAQHLPSTACASWEGSRRCPCYLFDEGIFLECSLVSMPTVVRVVDLAQQPIQSLSIYQLDGNVTFLPAGLFRESAGISSLQISHSRLNNVAESSFFGLEGSLQSLAITHSHLSTVPKAAFQKLSRLRSLDLEANNITELQSYSFFNMELVSVNLKENGLRLISEYAFDGLEETLEELNIMNNKLKQLPIPALRRLNKLRVLKANWNRISDVVSDGFSRLPALQTLDLSSNQFTELTSSSLANMPFLVSLSLSQNHISLVAGDSFIQNSGLQMLYMSNNNIMSLAPETFSYTMFIRVIDLGDNHLHSVSNGLLTNLPDLHEVFLTNNNILKISNNTFINSSKISVLYLQDNEIHSIESGAFANLDALFDLHLSSNNLQELPAGLFANTHILNSLSLDNNKISTLAEGTFSRLTMLKELRLHNNRLPGIEKEMFAQLTSLLELHLQDNVIDFIATGAFSSLRKLQHLNLEGNRLIELPDALSQVPANLITLKFSENEIKAIHTDAFRRQNKLEILWLSNNNLTTVQKILLDDLTFLQELYMENNQIASIQERCFDTMTKLELLSLSNNNLQRLTPELFEGLASLETLDLSNNRITEVQPQAFHHLWHLQDLDLSNNQILVVRRHMFEGNIPLRTLNLMGSMITDIDPYAFDSLRKLEELNLKRNMLAHVNKYKLFFKVPSLRYLNLADNKFELIEEDSFYSLTNLDTLDLSGCELARLPKHTLAEASELRSLNLAKNNIRGFNTEFFDKTLKLKELNLSFNNLNHSILGALEGLSNLEVLLLNGNPLTELRGLIHGMPRLQELYLSETHLKRMDNTIFTKLTQLKILDLSRNRLLEFPPGIFQGLNIERLSLADNSFGQIPNAMFLDGMSSLIALNMSGNPMERVAGLLVAGGPPLVALEELEASRTNLTMLTSHDLQLTPALRTLNLAQAGISKISPGSFRNLTQLTHLNLALNLLPVLPKERLRGLKSLSFLNLTGNVLKKLEQLPPGAHTLKVLDASGNMITGLMQSTFKHGAGIETLLLGSNWITSIHPRSFTPLSHLRHLDLSRNYLEELDTATLEPIERSLESLELRGNPLKCGCRVKDLWTWLQDHLSRVQDPPALTCHQPKTLSGRSFLSLPPSSFCPQPLIVRLAVRDTRSDSLLVSWQATNTTPITGFKVSFRETTRDGQVIGGLKTQSLPAAPRTHLLKGLRPSTDYLVCVHGLAAPTTSSSSSTTSSGTFSWADTSLLPRQSYSNNHFHNQPDMATKCLRVKTHEPPPPEIVLNNRLAIMIGASLGITIFFVAGTVICCCQMCKDRREAAKRGDNAAPTTQDYLSYRQFSVQGNDANSHEGYTEVQVVHER